MGRRSRRRTGAPSVVPPPPAEQPLAPPPRPAAIERSRRERAPQPPWGSFPLVELCALAAIVLGVWGIVSGNGVLLTGAAALGSVAGLEVAIREHLGGYRSHTLVLGGAAMVATLALALLLGAPRTVVLTVAPAVLIAGFVGFRQLFKRRSGGVGMRVR